MPVALVSAGLEGKLRDMAANIVKSSLIVKMMDPNGSAGGIRIGSVYPATTYLGMVRECDSLKDLQADIRLTNGVAGSIRLDEVIEHLVRHTGLQAHRCWIFGDTDHTLAFMVPPESEQVHSCVILIDPEYLAVFEQRLNDAIVRDYPSRRLKVAHRRRQTWLLKFNCGVGGHRFGEPVFVQGPLLWSQCRCGRQQKLAFPLATPDRTSD